MKIEISEEVWELWERSWALFGVKGEKQLIHMLEQQMEQESRNVLQDGEKQLLDNTAPAIVQRQIGLLKEIQKKKGNPDVNGWEVPE